MKVRLHLDGKRHFNEEQWTMIHDAFQFFVDKHKLNKHDVPVYIKFPEKLNTNDFGPFATNYGQCVTEFRAVGAKYRPERFIISITPRNIYKVIETIFHEMTHVMQELRGDIQRQRDGSEIYRGVHYSVDILQKPTYKQYRNFPWEVEAREVSYEMLKKWKASRDIKESFWQKLINYWS
jgi:hypothetical protein